MKWIWRIGGVLIAIIGVVVGGFLFLRASLPQTTGELRLAGLSAPVKIVRDRYGIPHISAQSEADAWFALGFVHAQDRLFQMEMMRRIGEGRLAELIGPSGLGSDRFMRALGVARRAVGLPPHLPAPSPGRPPALAARATPMSPPH